MTEAARFRLGILAALASSGGLAALSSSGCGSDVSTTRSASGSGAGGGAGNATSAGVGAESTATGVAQGAGGAVSSSSATGGTGNVPPPECNGFRPIQECYTLEQIEATIENPPMGGDEPRPPAPDDGPDGGVELTECPEPALVQNGCCNTATAGPIEQGDLCCYWFCDGACCGRPYSIDGRARIADPMRRADWLGERAAASDLAAIDQVTRAALAAAWLRDAQMEHASIASFARFTLELLSVGAPAEIVADSQRASLDEVEHARACFAQATRFCGDDVGPAPLDLGSGRNARHGSPLAGCAAAAVVEGCIGETIAAFVARQQLQAAGDESVRQALARIAADEERHAALSWRFVRWAIDAGDAEVRAAVAVAFEQGVQAASAAQVDAVDDVDTIAWRRFGRLSPDEMRAACLLALDEIVRPCAEVLLTAVPTRAA